MLQPLEKLATDLENKVQPIYLARDDRIYVGFFGESIGHMHLGLKKDEGSFFLPLTTSCHPLRDVREFLLTHFAEDGTEFMEEIEKDRVECYSASLDEVEEDWTSEFTDAINAKAGIESAMFKKIRKSINPSKSVVDNSFLNQRQLQILANGCINDYIHWSLTARAIPGYIAYLKSDITYLQNNPITHVLIGLKGLYENLLNIAITQEHMMHAFLYMLSPSLKLESQRIEAVRTRLCKYIMKSCVPDQLRINQFVASID